MTTCTRVVWVYHVSLYGLNLICWSK